MSARNLHAAPALLYDTLRSRRKPLHYCASMTLLQRLAILPIAAAGLWAQTFDAQLSGSITDLQGGVVADVRLSAKNVATGVSASATSNADGVYRFLTLPAATYTISAAAPGFKRFEQNNITLQVADIRTLNIKLEIGDATQEVIVSAAPPSLETQTATLGQVVTTRSIQNLPLNIRDPLALVALTAGVTLGPNFGNGGASDVGRNYFKSDFNVGGGRSGSQEILLDGAPDITPDINRAIINPPVDSVQEFKVQTNTYDAEFGRTTGGVVNIITKSGANSPHGVLYDFERNSALDANNFFNNRAGQPNLSFIRHQFGANGSGPVIKNKIFVFGDYEGLRQGYPLTFTSTVPTALQRAGDFSRTFTGDGKPIQIYDPNTLATLPDGSRTRTQFPNNTVPASRFDPVSQKMLSYYPLPNLPGDLVTGQNNFIRNAKSVTNSNKYDLRGDISITDATRMFLRYSHQIDNRTVPGTLPAPAGGGRNTTDTFNQAVADLTHVFNTNLIGDFQFSFSRALAFQYGLSQGFNVSSLGFPASYSSQTGPQFPGLTVSDITGLSNNGNDSFIQYQPRNTFNSRAGFTYARGNHTFKIGADWRVLDFNEAQNTAPSGIFSFSRLFTQGPNPVQASNNGGFGFASFLLGAPTSGTYRALTPISTQGKYYATYLQDDWRVTSRLTVNLGLRYEISTGDSEKFNRLAYLDLNGASSLAAAAGLPNLKGQLQWIGKGNSSNQQRTEFTNLNPRFGFAYKLTDKTVLRGGYGIFFAPRTVQGNGNGAIEAFRDTSFAGSVDGLTPGNTLSNPFPQGVLPPLNDRDPNANVGNSITGPTFSNSVGYVQLTSLGVQTELPFGFIGNAVYFANKGSHLAVGGWNLNQLPDQYLALGNALNDRLPNPFFGIIKSGALSGTTVSRQQLLLPYPQYTAVQQTNVPAGNSIYHAVALSLEKRATKNLTFLGSYTFSKAIDDISTPIDIYNRTLNKALSSFDTPQVLVMSFVYQLPYGRGRDHGANLNPIVNFLVGGWDLDGIIRLQSGNPVAIGTPALNNGTSAHKDRPTIEQWFDTSVFRIVPAFTLGNIGPRSPDVRTDRLQNVDSVLVKNFAFSVKEHAITTQFRAEVYNLLNNVQFASPNTSVSSSSFGRVTAQANNPRELQFGLKINF